MKRVNLSFDRFTCAGVSLVEVLVVSAVLAILVGGLVNLGVVSLKASDFNRSQAIALNLNREALEAARVTRDNRSLDCASSGDLFTWSGMYRWDAALNCFARISGLLTFPQPIPLPDNSQIQNFRVNSTNYQNFYRLVRFKPISTDKTEVTVWSYFLANNQYSVARTTTQLARWR